jgi:hypothetical protein
VKSSASLDRFPRKTQSSRRPFHHSSSQTSSRIPRPRTLSRSPLLQVCLRHKSDTAMSQSGRSITGFSPDGRLFQVDGARSFQMI